MDRKTRRLAGLTAGLLLALAGAAHAGPVDSWSVYTVPNTLSLPATSGGGTVNFTGAVTPFGEGDSMITIAQLTTLSKAARATPDVFTAVPWSVTVYIHDDASNKTGFLTITGELTGTLSRGSGAFTNHFDHPHTQHVLIGDTDYSLTTSNHAHNMFSSPGAPGSTPGAISVYLDPPKSVPEPSTLALAGLGSVGLWLAARRRRRATAAAT